jgi:hypothetical protein
MLAVSNISQLNTEWKDFSEVLSMMRFREAVKQSDRFDFAIQSRSLGSDETVSMKRICTVTLILGIVIRRQCKLGQGVAHLKQKYPNTELNDA